jgi:hypothetical protein
MKTPTIASPARMSESTYNKFTVHLPYVANSMRRTGGYQSFKMLISRPASSQPV